MLDNTTAVAYIVKIGGGGGLALHQLQWACFVHMALGKTETFGYLLPSSQALRTLLADFHSRNFRDTTVVFKQLTAISYVLEVGLFASRLNC